MTLAHDLLSPLVLLFGISAVVVLLYLFEKRRLLSHAFRYDLILLVPLLSFRFVFGSHLLLLSDFSQ